MGEEFQQSQKARKQLQWKCEVVDNNYNSLKARHDLCTILPRTALSGLPSFLWQNINFSTRSIIRFYLIATELWFYDGRKREPTSSFWNKNLLLPLVQLNPVFLARGKRSEEEAPMLKELIDPFCLSFLPQSPGFSLSLILAFPWLLHVFI